MKLKYLICELQRISNNGNAEKEVFVDMTGYGVHLSPIEEVAYNPKTVYSDKEFVGITIGEWIS